MGFQSEQEFAVYKTLDSKIEGEVRETTATFFRSIEDELSIEGWKSKSQVQKAIRVKIKDVIRGKVPASELQPTTVSLVDILKRN